MQGEIPAEQEDKDVVHDPIVQAIKEQRAQECSLGQAVNIEVERTVKARPVVERDLRGEQNAEARERHMPQQDAPERHEEVEPDEDDHEVELIFRIPKEEYPRNGEQRRYAHTVMPRIVEDVKERPHEIGQGDRVPPPPEKCAVGKRYGGILPIEQPERRDEEKNRHAKARADVKKRCEMKIWRGVCKVLRTDVNADHTHHGDAADRFDSGDPLTFTR